MECRATGGKTIPDQRTSRCLAHAARLLTATLAERLRPLGLAPAQFLVLQELWEDAALTQSDLLRRVGVEQATMAATLRRMQRDGLITRHPHPADHRAQVIRPTAHGAALKAPALAIAAEVDREAMDVFPTADRARLRQLLEQLLETLRA